MRGVVYLLACFVSSTCAVGAQQIAGARFGEWTGSLYSINDLAQSTRYARMDRQDAYVDFVERVRYDSLDFPEMDTYEWWPGSATSGRFAMEVHTGLEVERAGCYAFALHSDDGSKFYLDDSLIVDNGLLHGMRTTEALHYLEPGHYEAFVWYISVLPSKMGLRFTMERAGDEAACSVAPPEPVVLEGAALFASGQHGLAEGARAALEPLCARLAEPGVTRLRVVGHTDDVGDPRANLRLSKLRAGAVVSHLRTCADVEALTLEVDGYGADAPVADNETEAGRAANRRVEVWVE